MNAYLASEAPKEFKDFMHKLESQSDACMKGLAIYALPKNVAIWAVLTKTVQIIESVAHQHGFGGGRHEEVTANCAKATALAIGWICQHGAPAVRQKRPLRFTHDWAAPAEEVIKIAANYEPFVMNFSLWHKSFLVAEQTDQNTVKFLTPGGVGRRVRAYQQGIRPLGSPATLDHPEYAPIRDLDVFSQLGKTLGKCKKKGSTRISYTPPHELYLDLSRIEARKLSDVVRRDRGLDLGGYSLDEFCTFYASLVAICAVHECLCAQWLQGHGAYPIDSAVLVRTKREWTEQLTALSGLSRAKTASIIHDLSLGTIGAIDMHLHPFVPGDDRAQTLFLLPHFPIRARFDENILRVCSYVKPDVHNAAIALKEEEMISDLRAVPSQFKIEGPIFLPGGLPDIDLLVYDSATGTVVISELKWIRKTLRAVEHIRADADFLKGIQQLGSIQQFLSKNPDYLLSRKLIDVSLTSCELHFLLVGRDHFKLVGPVGAITVVAYDPFKLMLSSATDLKKGSLELSQYDWLPIEGRDFDVSYRPYEAHGVTLEAEVFFRARGPAST